MKHFQGELERQDDTSNTEDHVNRHPVRHRTNPRPDSWRIARDRSASHPRRHRERRQQKQESPSDTEERLKNRLGNHQSLPAEIRDPILVETIDEISVLKDLSTILDIQSIKTFDVKYEGNNVGTEQTDGAVGEFGPVTEHYFSVSFESSYNQLKSILGLMATNDYLLQVTNIKITDSEGGNLKVDMSLTAFTRLLETSEIK